MTGVCHQIANRILYPAGILVDQARGYNRSFRFYDDYGADLGLGAYWPQLARCDYEIYGPSLQEDAAVFVAVESAAFEVDGLREPEAAYVMENDPFVERSVRRMNLLLDRALGHRLDPGVRARVEQIAAATAARQRELVLAFENHEITPETYLDAFNELVATDFRRLDEVLGRDAFLAVFGEPPDVAAKIIDPKAFAAAHGLHQPG